MEVKSAQGEGAFQILPKKPSKDIQNLEEWTDAFMIFVSLVCQYDPSQIDGILTYGKFIRETAKKYGGGAWKAYDIGFRQQLINHKLSWGEVHWSLYFSCVNVKEGPGFRPKPFRKSKGAGAPFRKCQCFAFERSEPCRNRQCKFQHACVNCGGKHPSGKCNGKSKKSDNRSNNTTNTVHSRKA